MKKIIIILALLSQTTKAQSNFRINDREFFTLSTSIDPYASYKEKGIDIVGEIEYVGVIYAKAGFESFESLYGGYTDIHGAIGLNFVSGYNGEFRYYAGGRTAKVWREDSWRINYGLECGVDYAINENFFVGGRATYDKRLDQEIFGWNPENKLNFFLKFGYKWFWKNRGY